MNFERWLLAPVAPDTPLDPLVVYDGAGGDGAGDGNAGNAGRAVWRAYWAAPDDDLELAAIGAAAVLRPSTGAGDADRFRSVGEQLAGFDAQLDGVDATPPAGLVALGGFDFACERSAVDGNSSALTPGGPRSDGLVVPELLVVRRGSDVVAVGVAASRRQHDALLAAAGERQRAGALARFSPRAGEAGPASAGTDDDYLQLVTDALAAIDSGELVKVVTARTYAHRTTSSPAQLLAGLRAESPPDAAKAAVRVQRPGLFCFTAGAQSFVGASPEVLARFDGSRFTTCALAGSRRRTGEERLDDELRHELLSSEKERAEHDLVVRAIAAALASAGVAVSRPTEPEVMTLARIQHLHTPISGVAGGTAGGPAGVLDLVAALHPTPAVGGHPIAAALDWIDSHERIGRGWFCGPVGWATPDGVGEFRVGLRCARMVERTDGNFDMTLFAGGGIVAGAEPATELAETTTKLETLLAVAPPAHVEAAVP